jgi:TonB family protein
VRLSRAFAVCIALLPALAWGDPKSPPPVAAPPPVAVDAAAQGPSLAVRLGEIRQRVQAALVYPPIALRRAVSGETIISFAIDAQQRAEGVRTERSSGYPTLDRAAEQAARAAAPLPWVYGRVEVPVRFEIVATSPD